MVNRITLSHLFAISSALLLITSYSLIETNVFESICVFFAACCAASIGLFVAGCEPNPPKLEVIAAIKQEREQG